SGQLGGFNLDGTGLTWFGLPGVFTMYELEFGVWHEWIAYTSQNPDTGLFELVVARFPGGELKAQIPITEEEYDPKIKYIGDLDWSPDGELLVVSAMRDSENTDLYLYRKYGSYLERITFEGGWAYEPRWSPDGKLIVYKEFVDAGCGLYLIHRHEYNLETKENIIVDTDDISSGGCGMGPQAFHIEATDTTGKYKAILCIYCGPYNEGEGVYIQGPGDEEPRLVYRVEEYIDRATLRWEKVARRFIVSFNSNWLVFNREGSLEYKAKDLHISPDGSMVALVDHYDILTVYRMDNGLHELWSVTDPPFVNLALWIPNSDMLLVQAWSHIYHLDVSEQSVNIIGYNLAGGFDIYEGYWLSQNP
ncbi:MAG: hypothetical protein OEZ02_05740, partial [Anaerolineae bacterium]|nr:hypothetical protein [Anaerolineae bacterium]